MDCTEREAGECYYTDPPTLLSIKYFNINHCRILLKFGWDIGKQCCSPSIDVEGCIQSHGTGLMGVPRVL